MSKAIRSLYLHFPFCRSHCNYCDFYSEILNSPSKTLGFEASLVAAWNKICTFHDQHCFHLEKLETLYFGGGTPSLWGSSGAHFWKNFVQRNALEFTRDYEWTMEVNPNAYQKTDLLQWEDLGLNRYSVGIQTWDEDLLKILGRNHSLDSSRETLEFFQGKNFSADLMLGLPTSEGKRDVILELKNILQFGPKHLSVYILTVEENYLHFKKLPEENWVVEEYLKVSEYLRSQGYLHYEVSNFALPGFEAKHNLRYWETQNVAALGPSATGILVDQETAFRYKWDEQGEEFEVENLAAHQVKLEKFYMRLRTNRGINPRDFFAGEELDKFFELVSRWRAQGLLNESKTAICLSAQGYLLLDRLMEEIFISIKTF